MLLTIPLDFEAKTPLYEQIVCFIRRAVEAGDVSPGTKLPSKRALAAHLRVSVSTVETAYGQLTAEGYLASRQKSGFYVERLPLSCIPGKGQDHLPMDTPFSGDVKGESKQFDSGLNPSYDFDFSTNRVDTSGFPFSTWAKLMRQVLCEDSRRLLQPAPPQGTEALRRSIAGYLKAFRGMEISPHQIVVGAGSETLLSLVVQLLGHNRIYGVETPGYPKLYRILKSHGVHTRLIPMQPDGPSISALDAQGVGVMHVTPSHHFPLGISMPVSRRMELLAWADRGEGRVILEDDFDSELRYSGRPAPPLSLLDQKGRVIFTGSFAKSLAPSFRMGYLALPPALAERYRKKLSFLSSTLPVVEQLTLSRFMDDGYYERHLRRIRKRYRVRRDALAEALLESPLGDRITLSGGDAGTHLMVTLRGMGEETAVASARAAGIRVVGLSEYGGTPDPQNGQILLGFAGMDEAALQQGVQRLTEVWYSQ